MENGPASPDMGAMARRRVLPPVATRRPRWVLKPRAQCRLDDLPGLLREWAPKFLPESWKYRVGQTVTDRIGELDDAIVAAVEESLEDA
jgi:hypothetical protein